jgi:hypothetical protein
MALAVAREIRLLGPEPGSGRQLCMVCAMRYKALALSVEGVKELIEQAEAGTGSDTIDLRMVAPEVPQPHEAVALGISQALGNQIVPACWGHLSGVNFTSLMTAPGLPGGNGGLALPGR